MTIIKHRRKWRIAALLLWLVALMAPWSFDQINVPREYACGEGYVRLEGDFCGLPFPGLLVLGWNAIQLIPLGLRLLGGGPVSGEALSRAGFGFAMVLLLLPLFATVGLLWGGGQERRRIVPAVVYGLGAVAGMAVLALLSRAFGPGLHMWGVWLYVALAWVMVGLELWVVAAIPFRGTLFSTIGG